MLGIQARLLDKRKVGKIIAIGGEHLVFGYGKDCVIKIPFGLRYFLRPRQYTERVREDYAILKKYFGDYFIKTEVRVNNRKDWYALVQKKYHGRCLEKKDLANPEYQKQLNDILAANAKMKEELKITWEFFGAWALVFSNGGKISNIMTENGKLRMIDIGLIYLNNSHNTHWAIRTIVRWAVKKQKYFLQNFIGRNQFFEINR